MSCKTQVRADSSSLTKVCITFSFLNAFHPFFFPLAWNNLRNISKVFHGKSSPGMSPKRLQSGLFVSDFV
ncbi:hypothetical protein HanIR_Chr13g0639771 [Helianthus annuus]|nr:hypothetical protein HanIR_Chr13g0639771 [Helianthus annuus]